jgi:hypothetical protein
MMIIKTTEELISSRDNLLKKAGMSWKELEALGKSYQLDDDKYYIYKTIKSINWVLEGK